ncbi:ABC transporter ATP-binding protein [Alteraurantiacibacter aquimixticola]|uniref:ABC transporter ATP-binding protein n=1 Tax=Alteraurantiacibacter aquimixticola TaxID=2489173 RepID=A0A4T3EWY7_9SPHN|nr:ABC transporter ATP-binding protein [Alteraurantiacibacter aquimixticola]TIX48968.1 ABC transporter ATP-binding protein [Alteraurantiacibacter aquimixticola]
MKLRSLLRRAAPYRGQLLAISLLTVLSSVTTLAIPWLAGSVLGGVVEGATTDQTWAIVLLVVALVVMTALTIAVSILSAAASGRALAALRTEAIEHVQRLPMGYHHRSHAGDLLSVTTWEVVNLSEFLSATMAKAPSQVLTAIGAVILLFAIEPRVALFVPLVVPVFYIALRLIGRRLRLLGGQARDADATLISFAETQLELVPATKSFAMEEQMVARFAQHAESSRQLNLQQARLSALLGPLIALLAALAAIAVILLAGVAMDPQRSPAELFSFLLYAALLTRPVGALADLYGRYRFAGGTLEKLEAVLHEEEEPGYASGETAIPRGDIVFDAVSFAYPGRPEVLTDFSLTIPRGQVIAITGENGAGKSTLISLLLQFYRPDAGRIALDGRDVASFQVQALRQSVGVVPQRALLFAGSVRENICFGHPDAGAKVLERALRLAQATDFVTALPQGLDTRIGDHGVRLSGGQRQRIALARALLADPPVLVFDEATAMFDSEAEQAFVQQCRDALAGRTVILITHRPASLALAHRIIRMEHGRVVDDRPGGQARS